MKQILSIWNEAPVLNKVSYWVCLCLAAALLIAGFCLPPLGIIDNSVLMGTGILLLFASLGTVIVGIEKGMNARLAKGDASLELNQNKND